MDYVTVSDRASIALRRHGVAGSPHVLFVHSLALDGSIWADVVAELGESAETICVDCRGHGESSRVPLAYTVDRFADDLAEVLTTVGWEDAIVAGCSMGGCIAQAFAARHSSRVKGMALIDTTAWYGPSAPEEWRARAAKARAEGLASMADFQATRWFGDRFREENPGKVAEMMAIFKANDLDAYKATCIMLGDADLREALAGFRFPVEVIAGEEDYATPVESARRLAESIPQASLTILPGARHLTPIECPQAIAAAIRRLTGGTARQ